MGAERRLFRLQGGKKHRDRSQMKRETVIGQEEWLESEERDLEGSKNLSPVSSKDMDRVDLD